MRLGDEEGGWLRFNPVTALGISLAVFFVLGMRPVRSIFFGMSFVPRDLRELGLLLFVALLFFGYVAVVLVVTDADLTWHWARRWERRLESLVAAPYAWFRRLGSGQRRAAGGAAAISGAGLVAVGALIGGTGGYYWGSLVLMVAAWLLFGRFEGEPSERWTRFTRKAGLALVLLVVSSLLGDVLWWLIAQPWNPLSWRLYSLWAILHICVAVLCVGVLADTLGSTPARRVGVGALALGLLVLTTAWPVSVGEIESAGEAEDASAGTSPEWFEMVRARLERIPENEPVIFVAASGGGSRAALYATAVLEALERTPPSDDVGDWTKPEEAGEALADRVLFISSVSGGSLASAHYAFGGVERGDLAPPVNTLARELREDYQDEWKKLCGSHRASCPSPACRKCSSGEDCEKACVERPCLIYARLCTEHPDGYKPRASEKLFWPVYSKRVDDMATGFNAPLMRGIVRPGIERGQAMTRFWSDNFGWSDGWKDARARPGTRPLLLANVTDAELGTRLVAGFPRLPRGLLSGSSRTEPARSLRDLDDGLSVEVAEAVRMSANFPWGFDLPVLGAGKYEVLAIDGGVLDNSGVDTLGALLGGLEALSDSPRAKEELRTGASWLIDELARRGVVLLEIDSGAKPESPSFVASRFYSLFLPVHALSMASYVRSVGAMGSQVKQMQEILDRVANRRVAQFCGGGAVPLPESRTRQRAVSGDRLSHVVYVLDTENLMTAWALSPNQKAQLLARFLAEDAGQRLTLRDAFRNLEGANRSRCATLERVREDENFRRLLTTIDEREDELQRQQNAEVEARGEQRRALYQTLGDAGFRAGPAPQPPEARDGWIYVGQTDAVEGDAGESKEWLQTRLNLTKRSRPPADLVGRTIETSQPLYLLDGKPSDRGEFGKILGRLPSYTWVEIQDIQPWARSGFYFARVHASSRPPSQAEQ